ncbi:MAG TPA: hypothetical protein VNO75_08365 [Gemmatimonadaceae bacterium]|nr:hypothetical protein [Gemmatimonadaceae bacterium]
MRLKRHRNALLATAAFLGAITIAPAAQGQLSQLHPSFYGSAEWDTEDSQFYLLGMYIGVAKLGWSPYLNVNGYHLRFEDDLGLEQDLTAISPTLGLAYAGTTGGFSFGAGYTWVTDEAVDAIGAEGGGSDGVHVAFGAYRDGSGDRPVRTQFLSNYNFGAEYLWTRLRFSVPMTERTRVGLELVGQGGFEEDASSNTFKIGPTFEIAWNDNFRTGAVVGFKSTGGDSPRFIDGRENAAYFKVEFSLSPF